MRSVRRARPNCSASPRLWRNLRNPHYGERVYILLSAIPLLVMIASLADIITRGEHEVKNLNRTFWIIIVILLPLVGSLLWWAVGREYRRSEPAVGFGDPLRTEAIERRLADRASLSTEAELARLDAEIAQAENEARIRRLEDELRRRRGEPTPS